MKKYIKYFKYVFKHKFWVMIACFDMWLYWQWIIHDWSKFLPSEFIPYARRWWEWDQSQESEIEYNKSRLKHINRNPHHWNHWIHFYDDWTIGIIEMPKKYVKEMLCDWWWVGRSFVKTEEDLERYSRCPRHEVYSWYYERKDNMQLHYKTRDYIESFLDRQKQFEFLNCVYMWCEIRFHKIYGVLADKKLWKN